MIDEEVARFERFRASEEDIVRSIASIVEEVNRSLPSFKSVRSYFYSFKDMVRTTTLKVRRGVELQNIEDMFAKTKVSWQTLRGQNIDHFMEKYVHGSGVLPAEQLDQQGANRKLLAEARSERRKMEKARRKLQKRREELENGCRAACIARTERA